MRTTLVTTNHARKRLRERTGFTKYSQLLARIPELKIYSDNFNEKKFYLNLSLDEPLGFIVLKRIGREKYLILTMTDNGKIDRTTVKELQLVRIINQ